MILSSWMEPDPAIKQHLQWHTLSIAKLQQKQILANTSHSQQVGSKLGAIVTVLHDRVKDRPERRAVKMGFKTNKSQNIEKERKKERNGLSKPVKTVALENEVNCRRRF